MTFTIEEGLFTVNLTAISTVALALLMLLVGQAIKNRSNFLKKYCIPAPVIGGIIFSLLNLIVHILSIRYAESVFHLCRIWHHIWLNEKRWIPAD